MMWRHMHGVHGLLPFVFLYGLSRLLWIALIALLVWSLIHWVTRRGDRWDQPMTQYTPSMQHTTHTYDVPPMSDTRPDGPLQQPSALEILNRRYASGEIDAVTFENMRERILASQWPGQQQSM